MQLFTKENIELLSSNTKGIYRIFLFENDNEPHKIMRLLGIDESGLLYIGSSQNNSIQYRLKCFIHSSDNTRKQNNHSGGMKIFNNPNLQKHLTDKQLMFDYIAHPTARELERVLLNEYKLQYGEVPPLNG
jgi:hypothetical protein